MKTKLMMLASLAVLAAVAAGPIASASATTPKWWINGTQFTGEERLAISSTGPVKLSGYLVPVGGADEMTCESLGSLKPPTFHEKSEEEAWYRAHSPKIFNSTEGHWTMVLKGCTFTYPASCRVAAQLEAFALGNSTLAGEGVSVFDKFGTDSGQFLAYLVSGCASEGNITINGAPRCKLLSPAAETVVKQCEFSATSGSTLKTGATADTLIATVNVELAGVNAGKRWTGR